MLQVQEFANYQLQAPLSAHEQCSRFIALDSERRPVELRVIADACRESSDWEKLRKRLILAAIVQHSAIQQLVAVELEQTPPFVVLELRQGLSLAEEQRLSPLTLAEASRLGQHVSAGLAAAHRLGIVVGNISPVTIVARSERDWTIDITGLLTCHRPSDSAKPEAVKPPDLFDAPELTATGIAESASDVYSLASVINWLLPSTASWAADEPQELRSLLNRCLQEDPTLRPTATQLVDAFAELRPVTAESNSSQFMHTLIPDGLQSDSSLESFTTESCSIPPRLGRFELQDKLGEGAMGTVYRARDIADGSIVAIKLLNASVAGHADSLLRFAKEARLLGRANNPYVANLLEFNADDKIHYLAVEFVAGGTVSRMLQQVGRLAEPIALALILDVTRGLAIAHQRGIVHRDIKPDNILLTNSGQLFASPRHALETQSPETRLDGPLAKLSDFGLARTEQTESMAMTRDGAILGTPWYMSPEQCRGTLADARSDVYSLGATLFHLLAGRPPFEGDSPVAVINKQCHEPPPSLQQLQPDLSDATARVVEKCLAKNPDVRYADAVELQAEIEQVLKGEPTSMLLHPATPATGDAKVLDFQFSCDLAASPAQLWPYVSNTDRVNRSLGLPVVNYTTRVDPERGVERFAETRIAGQRLAWQEHPFEWTEGRRMSVLREFSLGPFTWFVSIVEMSPRPGGGTRLTQTLKVLPRSWLGRLLAKWELGRKSPRNLSRAYQRIDAFLAQNADKSASDDAFGSATSLSGARKSRLDQRLERLREQHSPPTVVETLGQYLEHAPDQEVARIRPLVFAERFRLDPQDVVAACLRGAREGLLVLLWDILCPSCRIPADVQTTLVDLQSHSYCPACDLKYEVDFANSVELIFRAHPELRAVETRTYCIGGPAFSAHVVSQTRLAPGERFALELNLGEGTYRIRGPQLPFAIDLRVSPQGVQTRWELPLLRPPLPGNVPLLMSGTQVITLYNDTPRELQVRVERTAGRQLALTAAAASSMAIFREMFPEQVLSPGQIVSVTNITLMHAEIHSAVDLYEQLGDGPAFRQIRSTLLAIEESVRKNGGAVVKIIGEGTLASFSDPLAACRAAVSLLSGMPEGTSPLRIAVHRGPALVTTLNDRLDYFGATPHRLDEILANANAGELWLTEDVAGQPEAAQLFQEQGLRIDIPPLELHGARSIVHRCRL